VYFYELHEGDDDVYSDALVVSESDWSPEDFFDLVQSIRRRIQDSFEDHTLVDAIAAELERQHGFVHVSDDRLSAAVNISRDEDDNFLAEIDDGTVVQADGRFRTIYADFDGDNERN
jgi:hypothetical protein